VVNFFSVDKRSASGEEGHGPIAAAQRHWRSKRRIDRHLREEIKGKPPTGNYDNSPETISNGNSLCS